MKNKIKVLTVAAAMAFGFAAFGAQQETWDSDKTEPIELIDDLEVTVESGVTVTCSGVISGGHKLIKKGAGTLNLAAANTFTGGLDIMRGVVTLSVTGAAGAGKITIDGYTNAGGACQLRFSNYDANIALANDIELMSSSAAGANAAIDLGYEYLVKGSGAPNRSITFNGPITAHGDLYIYHRAPSSDKQNTALVYFNKPVSAVDHVIGVEAAFGVFFADKVSAALLKDTGGYPGGTGSIWFSYTGNDVKTNKVAYTSFRVRANNCFPGSILYQDGTTENRGAFCTYEKEGPYNQEIVCWINTVSNLTKPAVQLSVNGEVTIKGGEGLAMATSYGVLGATTKLTLDAPGFTQTISGRPQLTTGPLTVKNGTLALTGAVSFSDLTELSIVGGTLDVTSTAEKVFDSVTTLPIGETGRLNLESGVDAFQETLDLQLTRGATLSIPDGLTVGTLTLDGMPYPKGTHTEIAGVTILGGALTVTDGPEFVNPVVVYVGEGEAVTDPDGLTGDKTLVKMGRGNLVLTKPSDFTGTMAIMGGVVEMQNIEALGTGAISIYGSTSVDSQLKISVAKDGFANPITIESDSSREHPAIKFERAIRLTAPVIAHGDFYFATAWGENTDAARTANVIFNAPVTVDDGKRIACAPHCEVRFKSGLVTQFLEGYFTEGPAPNGGNAGCIRVYRDDATHNPNSIGRLILDQTSFFCGNSDVIDGTVVEWTGEHPKNGYGYLDICGGSQQIGGFYTGEDCATVTEGLQIINSGASVALTLGNKSETDAVSICSANWYFAIGENFTGITWKNMNKTPTFRNRRHLVSGEYPHKATTTIGLGASFPRITTSEGSSGSTLTISSKEPDVLDSFVFTKHGSSVVSLTTDEAIACVSRGHKLRITSNRTGGGHTDYGFKIPSGKTLDAKSANLHPRSAQNTLVEVPCGKYTQADYYEFIGGTYRVWAARTAWTNVTWNGADDADLGAVANWTNTDDGEASAATFELPLNKATIASGAGATANGLVNFGGLTFSMSGSFTVGGDGIVAFYDAGLASTAGAAGRTITFNMPVDFQTESIAVAEGDTVVFAKGLTNEVWRTAATNFTVGAENRGTVVLNGIVPELLTVKGGELRFADGAVKPADDTLVLDIADGAKIYVLAGQTLRVKTAKYKGAELPVDYYTEFVTGGGKVRVAESTTPAVPTDLTWVAEGDEGALSVASNWENSPGFEFSWADKYRFIFTKQGTTGTGAVVDGPVSPRAVVFDAANGFTLKKGADDAVVTIGSEGILATNAEDIAGRTWTIEAPVNVDKTVNFTIRTNDTLILDHLTGSGSIAADDAGDIYINDAADFTGSFTAERLTVNSNEMKVVISGLFGAEGSQGTLTVSGNGRRCCCFSNATVRCKGSLRGPDVSPETVPGYLVSQRWFYSMDGTTNELFCGIASSGATAYLTTRPKAKMTLHGGYYQSSKVSFIGGGEFEFVDNPLVCWTRRADGFVDVQNGGRLTLNVTGNRIGHLFLSGGSVADFRVSDAWNKDDADKADAYFPYTMIDVGNGLGTFEFNQTTQFVGRVYGKANASTLNGTYPSLLVIRQGCTVTDVSTNAYYLGAKVTGGLSLRMDGITDGITQLRAASTSVGDLEVTGGTLELYTGASWLNGTNFTARSTGTLKFAAAGQVNKTFAALHVADQGKIYVPGGVRMRFMSATLNGEPVEEAIYPTGEAGSTGLSAHITGGGSIRIKRPGTILVVQ